MRFSTAVALSAFIASASAATFNVTVGENNANTFTPNQLTGVANGDTVSFRFVSKSHSVTQSTFAEPCTQKPGGVDSGFQAVAADATTFPQWEIRIDNASAPLWFYCNRAPHCTSGGMVFAINPTAERTFDAFRATAMGGAAPPPGGAAGSASGAAPATPTDGASGAGDPTGAAIQGVVINKASALVAGAVVLAGMFL